MNAVLEKIVSSQQVTDGNATLPLRHPDFPDLPVAVDRTEGQFLRKIIEDVKPQGTLEVGCAYGVSTLYICEAASALPAFAQHIVIDPFQRTQWRGIGLKHVVEAGYGHLVDFREEPSETVLPALVRAGLTLDFAFIDGWHTFDQVMVEFYYLNRLLRIGGVIAFDDADRRSVNRAIRHALTYPSYRVYGTSRTDPSQPSILGRSRHALAKVPAVSKIVRPDILNKDWDLGILGTCVAIQKIDTDARSSGWDRSF